MWGTAACINQVGPTGAGELQPVAGSGLPQDGDGRRPRPGSQRAVRLPVYPVGARRQEGVNSCHVGHDRPVGSAQAGVQRAVDVGPGAGDHAIGGGIAKDHVAGGQVWRPIPDAQVHRREGGGSAGTGLVAEEGDGVNEPAAAGDGEVVGNAVACSELVAKAKGAHGQGRL